MASNLMTSNKYMPGRRRHQGFSLLEVLVAFVVLSVSLGIILQIFSLSVRTTRTAEAYQQALLRAESKMSELVAAKHLEPGRDRGRFDEEQVDGALAGMRWETEVTRYEFPDEPPVDSPILQPYRIQVSVYWQASAEQAVTLTTVRMEWLP